MLVLVPRNVLEQYVRKAFEILSNVTIKNVLLLVEVSEVASDGVDYNFNIYDTLLDKLNTTSTGNDGVLVDIREPPPW